MKCQEQNILEDEGSGECVVKIAEITACFMLVERYLFIKK
jgi:hypothetical protein